MSVMKEINKWLDEDIVSYPSDPHKPKLDLDLNTYYTDTELKRFYSKKESKVIINEKTRRNDANNIFCELVDYCAKYGIYDTNSNKLLVNSSNKNSFYHFIYSNSLK